ncbi:MAG TPA: hypothetical protein VL096_15330, partial [Pirellulaceae bacterium]|nr:hypothetical protein [Pirellulaceae bacterium]
QAKELLYAQIGLKQADFKIPVGSTTTTIRAREEAERVQGRLDAKMLVCEKMLGERLYAALELLPVPQVAARIEDAAQLQTELENYYETLVSLMSQLGAVTKLRDERSALGALCSCLKDSNNSEALISSVLNVLKEVFRQIAELRADLVRVPYPFDHARGPIDVGHYCIQEMPLSDDLGGVYNAAGELLEGITQIYIRLLGNLVTAAESVETAVGLPKLEPRAQPEATPAS